MLHLSIDRAAGLKEFGQVAVVPNGFDHQAPVHAFMVLLGIGE
jgi:hypothetical protein